MKRKGTTDNLLAWMQEHPRRTMVGLHHPDYDQVSPEYRACMKQGTVSGILEKLEPRALAKQLRECHVQAFWFYSKGGYGNAFYPSKAGHVHSALKGRDWFGEMCEACLSEGIVPLGIYECSDARMRTEHPEWCHIPSGWHHAPPERFADIPRQEVGNACIHGPYRDLVIAQTLEVIRRYPIKGYYLDALGPTGTWLCRDCARAFFRDFGFAFREIGQLTHPQYVRYVNWQIERLREFCALMRRIVKKERPDILFTYNYCGIPEHCDIISCDLFSRQSGLLGVNTGLRRITALSRHHPAEVLLDTTTGEQDLFTAKALDGYLAELWTARALNVATCSSFIPCLDGTIPHGQNELTRKAFELMLPYEPWLRDMEPLFPIGILNSHNSRKFRPPEETGDGSGTPWLRHQGHHALDFEGWGQAAIANHCLWGFLDENLLTDEGLSRFRVLVTAGASCLSSAQVRAIRSFVRRGGILIADGETSLFDENGRLFRDFRLSDVFGVRLEGSRRDEYRFLEPTDRRMKDARYWRPDALHFREGLFPVRAGRNTRVLGKVLLRKRFTSGGAFGEAAIGTDLPGMTEHAFGRGRCFYIAGSPGWEYASSGVQGFCDLMGRILSLAVAETAPVEMEGPATVEMFAHRQKGRDHLVVNLVNAVWGCCRNAPGTRFEDIEEMPAAGPVTLRFRNGRNRKVSRVYLAPARKELPRTVRGGETAVILDRVRVHAMVVAEYR